MIIPSPKVPTVAALTGAAILVVGSSGSAGPEGVKFDWKQASGVPFIEREAAERAIPRNDADIGTSTSGNLTDHLKAIAFTGGFHFAFIEQGGTSLYPSLAQRVTNREVLRILLSIGPTETQHFQTWQDKAGNATPLTDIDPVTGSSVTFLDHGSGCG